MAHTIAYIEIVLLTDQNENTGRRTVRDKQSRYKRRQHPSAGKEGSYDRTGRQIDRSFPIHRQLLVMPLTTIVTAGTNKNSCRLHATVLAYDSESGNHSLRLHGQDTPISILLSAETYSFSYGKELVGKTIRVFWAEYNNWFVSVSTQ